PAVDPELLQFAGCLADSSALPFHCPVMIALRAKAELVRRLPSPEIRRALRVGASATLADVATHCGVTVATVSRWERGLRHPRGEQLGRYIDALDELREVAQ